MASLHSIQALFVLLKEQVHFCVTKFLAHFLVSEMIFSQNQSITSMAFDYKD